MKPACQSAKMSPKVIKLPHDCRLCSLEPPPIERYCTVYIVQQALWLPSSAAPAVTPHSLGGGRSGSSTCEDNFLLDN